MVSFWANGEKRRSSFRRGETTAAFFCAKSTVAWNYAIWYNTDSSMVLRP